MTEHFASDTELRWMSDDARRSYEFGLAAQREERIRLGLIQPTTDRERLWAYQGPRPWTMLDTVKNPDG